MKLYRCGSVDMYSAPHTYKRRRPGEDGGMRQSLASAALHGRLFIDEGDDTVWLCGASVKDAGRKMFALIKMATSPDFILNMLPAIP